MNGLTGIDWIILCIYFVAIYFAAFWDRKRFPHPLSNSANYFLAGRNMGWFVIGASMFAANIGSEHLVGLAGTGAARGLAVAHFELLAALILIFFSWFFIPFYLKSAVYTMPEFLERRYSPAARWYFAVISIIGYILTKISVTIAAGAMVLEVITGINFWVAALIIVIASGIYTLIGGLRAVMITSVVQMFVFVSSAIVITWLGLDKIGGWQAMRDIAGTDFFNMWKPISDPDFPWTGIIFGAPILAIWYWCTDQYIVQKTLSASTIDEARGGSIFTAYLKLLPLFIFVIPGIIIYGLAQKGIVHLTSPDQAFSILIQTLLPAGLRGLAVAGLLAALMSSLSSVFIACSSLITLDIYKKIHPQASDHRLVIVGQSATLLVILIGVLWIPFIKLISGQIYEYLQSIQAYLSPPIAAVFLIGLLWPRVNAKGAMTALVVGFLIAAARLYAEMHKNQLNHGHFWYYFATFNYLHFAILLFILCSVLLAAVSLMSAPANRENLTNLTLFTTIDGITSKTAASRWHIWLSIILILTVGAIWYYFYLF